MRFILYRIGILVICFDVPASWLGVVESAVRRWSIPRFHCPRTALSENFVRGVGECGARCPTAAVRFMSHWQCKGNKLFRNLQRFGPPKPLPPITTWHKSLKSNAMDELWIERQHWSIISSGYRMNWDRRGNGSALPPFCGNRIQIGEGDEQNCAIIPQTPKRKPRRNQHKKAYAIRPYRASGSHVCNHNSQLSILNSQLESILNWNQLSFAPVSRLFWSQVSRSQTVGVRKSLISSSDALL